MITLSSAIFWLSTIILVLTFVTIFGAWLERLADEGEKEAEEYMEKIKKM